MSLFTLGTLRTAIKLEARQTDTNLDAVITAMINDVIADLANRENSSEFIIISEDLTITSPVVLPENLNKIIRVSYQTGSKKWDLADRNSLVSPAPVVGRPSCYSHQDGFLYLFPDGDGADTLTIDYYYVPDLLVNDPDEVILYRAWPEVYRSVLQRLQMFNNKAPDMIDRYAELVKQATGGVIEADKS